MKLPVVWVVTWVVLVLSYDLLVRSIWIGKWLSGHRRPREIVTRRSPVRPDRPVSP